MSSYIQIEFSSFERADIANNGMLAAQRILGGTIVYESDTKIRYNCDEKTGATDVLDWLIASQVIDPVNDDYAIGESTDVVPLDAIGARIRAMTDDELEAKVKEYSVTDQVSPRDTEMRARLKIRCQNELSKRRLCNRP